MKIVITGALGHIGSYLLHDLPKRFSGLEIVMIDNLSTQRYASLFHLPAGTRYRFVEGDVTAVDLGPHFTGARAAIHLAAVTDAEGSFDKAALVESNNYECTRRVAEACAENGVRLITLSSTSVYGTQEALVSEDCSIDELKPQSPYAETKLREEALVRRLVVERDLRAVICRFGTIFGPSPGMRFHTAVNKFCWQAIMGQPLTVWRTAYDQKRPYLELGDAAAALAFLLAEDIFDGRIYNVLTRNATVRQIVETIRHFIPDLAVRFVDSPIMNQLSYEVTADRIKDRGFAFSGELMQGIGATLTLLRNANAASVHAPVR